jgi:hypothetical protein
VPPKDSNTRIYNMSSASEEDRQIEQQVSKIMKKEE